MLELGQMNLGVPRSQSAGRGGLYAFLGTKHVQLEAVDCCP